MVLRQGVGKGIGVLSNNPNHAAKPWGNGNHAVNLQRIEAPLHRTKREVGPTRKAPQSRLASTRRLRTPAAAPE